MNNKISQYLEWDPNPMTRNEIKSLVEQQNTQELEKRMNRLTFGTAIKY